MVRKCRKCGRKWYYPVETCIFCGVKLDEVKPGEYTVKGVTEVFIPSTFHRQVPYYDLLLEDEQGNHYIKKTFEKHGIGDKIEAKTERKKLDATVGVVGTGIGKYIAELAAESGFKVVFKSRSRESLKKAMEKIEKNLLKTLDEEEKNQVLSSIKDTRDYNDLRDCNIIIESVVEDYDVKKKVFQELDGICGEETIFATNTSSLSVDRLAATTKRPRKFMGLHFFNPPTKMRLVEIVRGSETSQETIEYAERLADEMNKTAVVVKDTPCFIVNRVLMPYLNEAVLTLEDGTAAAEDIDNAAKLGLNHPMGPLALLDLIGLDVFVRIMNNMYERTDNPKYKPSELAVKMVKEGKLGRKTKEGFYTY